MERPLALVVDGDAGLRARVKDALAGGEVETLEAAGEGEGLEALKAHPVRVMLLASSFRPPERRAYVEKVGRLRPSIATVIVLDRPSPWDELEALRSGAFAVLSTPPDPERLRLVVDRALAQHDLLEERRRLRDELGSRAARRRIVGRSDAAERLRERLDVLAATEDRVLFMGDAGTGRTLAAQILHALSPRRGRPFTQVDCASGPEEALEAEMFGWEGGTLSGRARRGDGMLEGAKGGTALLNEVDALPARLQDRLLAAIRAGSVLRLGGTATLPFDARIVASTRFDLSRLVAEGRFREGLYGAFAGAIVDVPALRERREDIGPLAAHFIEEIRSMNDLPPIRIAPETLEVLGRHAWPGNVRELRHAIEQAVILASDGTIRPRDLPEGLRAKPPAVGDGAAGARFREAKRRVVESFEKRYLAELLARHQGNVTAAAQQAGMLRSALQRLLRKYELRSSEFRGSRAEPSLD
jgi:DNA-binding NtrC family response regulator